MKQRLRSSGCGWDSAKCMMVCFFFGLIINYGMFYLLICIILLYFCYFVSFFSSFSFLFLLSIFPSPPSPADSTLTAPYFYSCYSTFTGEPIDFVDPQLDSMGMFLMGAYHLFLNPATRTYLNTQMANRILNVTNFLLNVRGYNNLIPADYAPWEESSDQMNGTALPRGYFAWTQAFGYVGLHCAGKVLFFVFFFVLVMGVFV